MEAKELMIGDWVCENSIPHQIYELGTTFCTDRKTNLLFTDSLQPVLLTEEILMENGFRPVSTWMYKAVRECGTFDVCVDLRYDEIQISKISGVGTDCEECDYDSRISLGHTPRVHELQHALRLCGLREFADNFKI